MLIHACRYYYSACIRLICSVKFHGQRLWMPLTITVCLLGSCLLIKSLIAFGVDQSNLRFIYPPCIGDSKPKFNILILSSVQYSPWTHISGDDLETEGKALVCDHLLFHAADLGLIERNARLIQHQIEWAQNFPEDCLLSISQTCRPKARIIGSSQYKYEEKYETKFHTNLFVQDLIQRKRIVSSINDTTPWAMFTDVDFIFANKFKGVESVINRLKSGFSHGKNDTRPYYTTEDVLYESLMKTNRILAADPPSFEDMAVAIAMDVGGPKWLYNSGALIFKPSTTASFLWDSTLWLFNQTSALRDPDFSDTGDQGIMSIILRDGFDFETEFHGRMVYKARIDNLEAPCEGDQLIAVHRINLNKLLLHPALSGITLKWFPQRVTPPGEPTSVALVCTRWFNAPACGWAIKEDSKLRTQKSQRFNCDDFAAHMNGCPKSAYKEKNFRDLFKEKVGCKESFSFTTNEDGSPFTWEE